MNIKPLLENLKGYAETRLVKGLKMPIYYLPLKREELEELLSNDKRVRFIADLQHRKTYIFSTDLTHQEVDKAIDLNKFDLKGIATSVIYGQAVIEDKKVKFTESFTTETMMRNRAKYRSNLRAIAEGDWSFVSNYMAGFKDLIDMVTEVSQRK
jgi:hypothetical protein